MGRWLEASNIRTERTNDGGFPGLMTIGEVIQEGPTELKICNDKTFKNSYEVRKSPWKMEYVRKRAWRTYRMECESAEELDGGFCGYNKAQGEGSDTGERKREANLDKIPRVAKPAQ